VTRCCRFEHPLARLLSAHPHPPPARPPPSRQSNTRRYGALAAVVGLTLLCAVSLSANDAGLADNVALDQLNLHQEGAALGLNLDELTSEISTTPNDEPTILAEEAETAAVRKRLFNRRRFSDSRRRFGDSRRRRTNYERRRAPITKSPTRAPTPAPTSAPTPAPTSAPTPTYDFAYSLWWNAAKSARDSSNSNPLAVSEK